MIATDLNREYNIGEFKFINYVFLTHTQKIEILKWRNQDVVREKMYNTDVITEESHLSFIESLKNKDDRSYWYVTKNGEYIGSYNIIDYCTIDSSCESGIFFKDTSLRSLNDNIIFAKSVYELSFQKLGIELMRGFVKKTNLFMINLTSYFGFSIKECDKDAYIKFEMTKKDFLILLNKRSVNMRDFINFTRNKQY